MDFGIYIAPTPDSRVFAALAVRVEDRGFGAVYLPEHTHVPIDLQEDQPGRELFAHATFDGGDPFIHLAAAAVQTERILLGTSAALLPQHDVITMAKVVSTLDVLSGGRVVLGLGAGWNRAEMERHGVPSAQRWAVFREKLEALQRIWADDVSEYHGAHVDFDPIAQLPKPVQRPGVPVYVCANGPTAIRIAAEVGDGWQPHLIPGREDPPFPERIADLRRLAAGAGKPDPAITVCIFNNRPDAAQVAHLESLGVGRCVYRVSPREPEEIDPLLDAVAAVAGSFA
jgi:probable F420-dependent oxidoreductase